MKRRYNRPSALAAAATSIVCAALMTSMPATADPKPPAYQGTLVQQRADSQITKIDGYYYFTGTVPEYDRLILRRARTLEGLASAPEVVIWRAHASGAMANHIWAPEIHRIDGKWYVYFAAGHSANQWDIGMYVLEATGDDPTTATWDQPANEKGQIVTPVRPAGSATFALDATTFVNQADGTRYLVWAETPNGGDSSLWLAKLANPWTLGSAPVLISRPEYDWETQGYRVNEGPAVLQHDGKIFITYSASATDGRYALGMLTVPATSNLLDPKLWRPDTQAELDRVKSRQPVFASNAANSQFGPGHNSFVKADDGVTDVLVYHDRDYTFTNREGTPPGDCSNLSQPHEALIDVNRRTRIQTFTWNADGTPNFGTPVADTAPVRLRLHSAPEKFVRHYNFRARLDADPTPGDDTSVFTRDSSFRVVPGLAGGDSISFESANFPSCFLTGEDGGVYVRPAQSGDAYAKAASFRRVPGLGGAGASFASVAVPGGYLHRRDDDQVYVDAVSTDAERADATFDLSAEPVLPAPDPAGPSPSPSTSPSASPSASPSPSTSASPSGSPTVSPSTSAPGATPTASRPAGSTGGGLAVTGSDVAMVAGIGLAGIGLGLLLYVLGRRRRTG